MAHSEAPIPRELTGNGMEHARSIARHRYIIEANKDALVGKRILDLASYNGRWTYAAMKAGAVSAVGVTASQASADKARALFQRHGITHCQFVCADILNWLTTCGPQTFDTIVCPGVNHHVMDHCRLFTLMARLQPKVIIMDDDFVRSFRNCIYIGTVAPDAPRNATPAFDGRQREALGLVSLGLMIQIAWNSGYNCRPVPWRAREIGANAQPVKDYLGGRRFTLRFEPMQGRRDAGWETPWREALTAINPKWANLLSPRTHDTVADRLQDPIGEFSVLAQPSEATQERRVATQDVCRHRRKRFPKQGGERPMGMLLRFPDARRNARAAPVPAGPATVVILPVVRIERSTEQKSVASPRPRSPRGRRGRRPVARNA